MKITDVIKNSNKTQFSLEILPPLKGQDIEVIRTNIDPLIKHGPAFISITYHRDEVAYHKRADGYLEQMTVRKRPGTVALAAALMYRYNIPVVPHLICGGFNREETENELIDLNFLGIDNLLVLRGDPQKCEHTFKPKEDGHSNALDLLKQVQNMNSGSYLSKDQVNASPTHFSSGIAAYPEKHPEAPNMKYDIDYMKQKVDNGAEFAITQMFFDNRKYMDFVEECAKAGVNIPIIPGIKPVSMLKHLNLLPQTFQTRFPEPLVESILKCKTNTDVRKVGIEWAVKQSEELIAFGVPDIHYFTMGKSGNIEEVIKAVFAK